MGNFETHSPLALLEQLQQLRSAALALEAEHNVTNPSARNLLHYLSLRQRDIRQLQLRLSHFGLSSLADSGSHTLARLNAVISLVESITGTQQPQPPAPVDDQAGPQRLHDNTRALLGAYVSHDHAHIMVTMPSDAATNAQLVQDLLAAGMTVMRVNCAHDDSTAWRSMVGHLSQAKTNLDKPCLVQVDLAGPKLRTGPIEPSAKVIKLKPQRDLYGHVLQPKSVALVASEQTPLPGCVDSKLVLSADFVGLCKSGDVIEFDDCRGRDRSAKINVENIQGQTVHYLQLFQTCYVSEHTRFRLYRKGQVLAQCQPQNIPDVVQPIELQQGDTLVLTRAAEPGRLPQNKQDGSGEMEPARVHCTLPQAFDQAEVGHSVWFDDGKIGAVVRSINHDEMTLEVTHGAPQGNKLRSEKGINFPDTALNISALTSKDKQDLLDVVQWADIVALSFVRSAGDVNLLHQTLLELDKPGLGVVLKIENKQAFDNLPSILLAGIAMERPFGVMIARGDLAVEVGFERLAEVQQEILWLCEAAHVPVVWATQILESMAKKGLPSRAEVSDAGMGVLAECAMLNKGPYILQTVELLKGILSRMDSHYQKRRATLRKLSVAKFDPAP